MLRIGKYNELHSAESADGREKDYDSLVDSYYDLATDFYEWGWGSSFHFAHRFVPKLDACEVFADSNSLIESGTALRPSARASFATSTTSRAK